MAKATPEGKVKKQLLDFLKTFGDDCFYYMPVQNGMGQSGIPDVMAIIHRVPFAFECKATPKQHPTTLQAMALERIHNAGGVAWVVDNESIHLALEVLHKTDWHLTLFSRDNAQDLMNEPTLSLLYRWRDKLEPMEFESASRS